MDAIYTDTGQGNAKYRIVERYSNWDKYPDVHSYFFAITDTGEGIVFHSPTTNGGKMYLKPTDNKELQENLRNCFINKKEKTRKRLFSGFVLFQRVNKIQNKDIFGMAKYVKS